MENQTQKESNDVDNVLISDSEYIDDVVFNIASEY